MSNHNATMSIDKRDIAATAVAEDITRAGDQTLDADELRLAQMGMRSSPET